MNGKGGHRSGFQTLIFACESNKTSTGNVHMTRYIIIVEVKKLDESEDAKL